MKEYREIGNMRGITCRLYHLNDAKMSKALGDYYRTYLREKFVFRAPELKRTQFCLDLADMLIGEERECMIADIGPGRRLFTGMMCERGYREVTAIDLKYYDGVDIVRKNFRFLESSIELVDEVFDYTFCFEVLEHIPLKYLKENIEKIRKITRNKAVISLPYYEDPIKTKGHLFTLDTLKIDNYFQESTIYFLYREEGFSYIFFVFDGVASFDRNSVLKESI